MTSFVSSLFRRRRTCNKLSSSNDGDTTLKRVLGAHDLVLIGLGNIVGGGIYILFGIAVQTAGPAVTVSFLGTGLAATCSALCYAEFAGRVPEAGSAYVFTYMAAGEFLAWNVAWAMILEMVTGAAAVSVGWSNYTRSFLVGLGVDVPWILHEVALGAYFKLDLMSLSFLLFLTCTVAMGISESKWLNHVATSVKVGALLLVIVFAFNYADIENWADFNPHGAHGIVRGAATVMFAFTGFEVVAQCAEETNNPRWAMPVGIVGSVLLSTMLYTLVAASVTLMVPYGQVDLKAPLALAFAKTQPWLVPTVSAGAVIGLFAIGMGSIFASSRLLMILSRDRLIPACLGPVNASTQTPVVATVLVGSLAALETFLFSYEFLAQMVSVGTMFAFTMVCIDLVITRAHDETRPAMLPSLLLVFVASCAAAFLAWEHYMWVTVASAILGSGIAICICTKSKLPAITGWGEDHFTVPCGVGVALFGVAMNTMMTLSLEAALEWNIGWFMIGWVIYFGFGRLNSRMASDESAPLI